MAEWKKLQATDRKRFEKILERRLWDPVVPKDMLSGQLAGSFKIKLKGQGLRLVYQLIPDQKILFVRSVGSRAGSLAYGKATTRKPDI